MQHFTPTVQLEYASAVRRQRAGRRQRNLLEENYKIEQCDCGAQPLASCQHDCEVLDQEQGVRLHVVKILVLFVFFVHLISDDTNRRSPVKAGGASVFID